MSPTRGYNAPYVCWEGMPFPNNLEPSRGAPALSYDQFCANLEMAGVNILSVSFSGWNNALSTGATSFERALGDYNNWGGRLEEFADACQTYDIGIQAVPFFNTEFRTGWGAHAWNTDNGGLVSVPRDVFSNTAAIDAAKDRLEAIVDYCGDIISSWKLMEEMSWLCVPSFWGVSTQPEMAPYIYNVLCTWVDEMARHIQAISTAPVGNGQVFVSKQTPGWPDTVPVLRNEPFRVPSLDFATINWYGTPQDTPLPEKVRWMRAVQAFADREVRVEQYAPWEAGRNEPYTREPANFSWSKEHEWAAICGEAGAGPLRWIENKPVGDIGQWWGAASPQMAEIAGISRWFGEVVDPDDWTGPGIAYEQNLSSDEMSWASAWGDGRHVTAFVTWVSNGGHDLSITGLVDGEYDLHFFDWLTGDQVAMEQTTAVGGRIFAALVPNRERRALFYLCPHAQVTPQERTMRVTLTELQGDDVLSFWEGKLTEVPA
jgi:hypothetical protein